MNSNKYGIEQYHYSVEINDIVPKSKDKDQSIEDRLVDLGTVLIKSSLNKKQYENWVKAAVDSCIEFDNSIDFNNEKNQKIGTALGVGLITGVLGGTIGYATSKRSESGKRINGTRNTLIGGGIGAALGGAGGYFMAKDRLNRRKDRLRKPETVRRKEYEQRIRTVIPIEEYFKDQTYYNNLIL